MLTIQRASAGSGKTYTLAKKYILSLIAYKREDKTWKLRNERQIEDAIHHILAITFTNKATNEMKQRIVGNLSLLAQAAHVEITEKVLKDTPYLSDFHEMLNEPYEKIGEAAAFALKIILNNYSLFKISTIDSFFQEILRTFAFEANLNDSYQLELDSTFVTDSALETAIHKLDTHPEQMGNAAFWFKTIMRNIAQKNPGWNPFNKKNSKNSVYGKLRENLKELEKENFKEIKQTIDSYFSDPDNIKRLSQVYFDLKKKAEKERENQVTLLKRYLTNIKDLIKSNGYSEKVINKNFLGQLDKIARFDKDTIKIDCKYESFKKSGTVFKKGFQTHENPVDIEMLKMYDLLDNWIPERSYFNGWLIYGPLIPYLGLILEVRNFISQVLESNNLIRISDTAYILKKIIGDNDTPFVYERLGNRIDHYLIDEFQDTSRMQWDVIRPLLDEGMAKSKDSLIIGDPKQSIYRFRNADHRLITKVVPASFDDKEEKGYSIEENTNWRSQTEVVNFNNYFFKALAQEITKLSKTNGGGYDFSELYSNVEQYPNNQDGKGYVEIRVLQKPMETDVAEDIETETETDDEKIGWFEKQALQNLPVLISDLLKRGYRQKDICVLVNTNERGRHVVKALLAYNQSLPEDEKKIDFLSEESLLIGSSPAIEIILGVISKFADPSVKIKNPEEADQNKKQKYYNWNSLKSDFNIFSRLNSQLSPAEKILGFLRQYDLEENLSFLIDDLSTPTLSSLVEAIIKNFLDEDMLKSEAIYLASFQDMVAEFSSSYQDDPALFMEWWQARGSGMSVSTPEGTDAVQIMTIHKSKGLEFNCVIVPFATDSFSFFKPEWRWVKPYEYEEIDMPAILPISTTAILKGTIHEKYYTEFYDQVLTDRLNNYYVAFTRAKNELYVFTSKPTKGTTIGTYLIKLLFTGDHAEENTITFGEPMSKEDIEEMIEKDRLKNSSLPATHFFKDYFVNKKQPRLLSKASTVLPSGENAD